MDDGTPLLRQVHPNFVRDGHVASQAFRPRRSDGNRLSVYDGDRIAPEAAWRHYTGDQSLASAGVMAVTVAECVALDLPAQPDPAPFPEHAVIDFGDRSRNACKEAAKALRDRAYQRGWLYQASRA